ncbi:hypothetical protein TNCV_2244691 [Trichonephila clavipes]|nr:hypothetical protein TNCV_2244691 [Trichonephila clavipes]
MIRAIRRVATRHQQRRSSILPPSSPVPSRETIRNAQKPTSAKTDPNQRMFFSDEDFSKNIQERSDPAFSR